MYLYYMSKICGNNFELESKYNLGTIGIISRHFNKHNENKWIPESKRCILYTIDLRDLNVNTFKKKKKAVS